MAKTKSKPRLKPEACGGLSLSLSVNSPFASAVRSGSAVFMEAVTTQRLELAYEAQRLIVSITSWNNCAGHDVTIINGDSQTTLVMDKDYLLPLLFTAYRLKLGSVAFDELLDDVREAEQAMSGEIGAVDAEA